MGEGEPQAQPDKNEESMGWAAEEAKRIREITKNRRADQEWTLFVNRVINEGADELWGRLIERVESDTKEFDEHLDHKSSLRAARFPNNVTVQRYAGPLQRLQFIYTPKSCVEIFWNDRPVAKYPFAVDDHGGLWFRTADGKLVTVEDVSHESFTPLMEFYANHVQAMIHVLT